MLYAFESVPITEVPGGAYLLWGAIGIFLLWDALRSGVPAWYPVLTLGSSAFALGLGLTQMRRWRNPSRGLEDWLSAKLEGRRNR